MIESRASAQALSVRRPSGCSLEPSQNQGFKLEPQADFFALCLALNQNFLRILRANRETLHEIEMLRIDAVAETGQLCRDVAPRWCRVAVPDLAPGRFRLTYWDTEAGRILGQRELYHPGGALAFAPPGIVTDLAIALRQL